MELAIGKKRVDLSANLMTFVVYSINLFFWGGLISNDHPWVMACLTCWPMSFFFFLSTISYTHCFLTWDGVSGGFTYQLGNPILPGKILIDYNDYTKYSKWVEITTRSV